MSAQATPAALVEAERAAWITLHTALLLEETALVEGEVDNLDDIEASKETSLRALAERVRARVARLNAAGLANDRTGVERWLADADEATRTQWADIVRLEAETRAINQRNGGMIEQRMNLTRQALNVLLGAAAARGNLYDQNGQNRIPDGGRTINAA